MDTVLLPLLQDGLLCQRFVFRPWLQFVQNAVMNEFLYYLSSKMYWGMPLPISAAIVNTFDGVRAILLVIITHLAEAYYVVVPIICLALGLLALGDAGTCPLDVFLSDQIADDNSEEALNNGDKDEKVGAGTQFWRSVAVL
ncbi:unnamed protein product [Dovyalis caffra]|uniref:Battenin n=1 Tax=Dovyalis caffra TaxID=77055 RepID=A0AAV1S903_9ROSI|nr:unnamed protein product [Dovyalis caffra]